jgi:hypothetical protein
MADKNIDESIAKVRDDLSQVRIAIRMDEDGPQMQASAELLAQQSELEHRLSQLLSARNTKIVPTDGPSKTRITKEELAELGLSENVVMGRAEHFKVEHAIPVVAKLEAADGVQFRLYGKTSYEITLHEGDRVELVCNGDVIEVIGHKNGLDRET